jgi:hypothetical protein
MKEDDSLNALFPGTKQDKRRAILDELDTLDIDQITDSTPSPNTTESHASFLPSSQLGKKKKKHEIEVSDQEEDDWFNDLVEQTDFKIGKAHRSDIFQDSVEKSRKKKSKKDKKKNKQKDFAKEFEPEAALLRNLMIEQSRFVDSLQRQYDHMMGTKSSSRGITKNMTDLIANITQARKLNMDLTNQQVNLKKTIADLTLKQQKDAEGLIDDNNLSDFASTYLKQMISERQAFMSPTNTDIADYTPDEMSDIIDSTLQATPMSEEDRSPEAEQYLKYENRDVSIQVIMDRVDTSDYEFIAIDKNGIELTDYPLPLKTSLNVNRSTQTATDVYGQKYKIVWKD